MLRLVRQGVIDFVGAARPSIADPFLPRKIDEGREDDIRECIGCNICYAGDQQSVPIRCTQNPSLGEEWRRGWHPEYLPKKSSDASVLIVGGGPAGLEAAQALGKRGYAVTLAEARTELGGRVAQIQLLPFRKLGEKKYASLGMPYPMAEFEAPPRELWERDIRSFAEMMRSYGLDAVAGSGEKVRSLEPSPG